MRGDICRDAQNWLKSHPELKAIGQARFCPRKHGSSAKVCVRAGVMKETAWEIRKLVQDENTAMAIAWAKPERWPQVRQVRRDGQEMGAAGGIEACRSDLGSLREGDECHATHIGVAEAPVARCPRVQVRCH